MSLESPQTQLNGQEIEFKKRARRRLVGAIALVLMMIAILPMVLDDRSNKTPPQEIAISIPSQDGGEFTSKIVPTTPVEPLPATTSDEPDPMRESVTDPAKSQSGDQPPVVDSPAQPALPALAKTEKPAEKPAEKPVKKEPAKAVAQPADTISNTSAGKSPDDKKQATAAAPAYVQIGVFSDAANVKQLQQKLLSMGFKSFTEKIDTSKGEKTRLRVGPFSSRSSAEDALDKVKAGGLGGMVVSK